MTSRNSKIKAVAFDAFGTLIKYGEAKLNPYSRLLSGSQVDQAKHRHEFLTRNVSVNVFAAELNCLDQLPSIRQELETELAGLELFEEVQDVLHSLRVADTKIAVCSNLAAEYCPALRRLLPGLDSYVLSCEVGHAKPDAAIYQAVCTSIGVAPIEIGFIGDSQRCDLYGPRGFGMKSRWLDRASGQTLQLVLDSLLKES